MNRGPDYRGLTSSLKRNVILCIVLIIVVITVGIGFYIFFPGVGKRSVVSISDSNQIIENLSLEDFLGGRELTTQEKLFLKRYITCPTCEKCEVCQPCPECEKCEVCEICPECEECQKCEACPTCNETIQHLNPEKESEDNSTLSEPQTSKRFAFALFASDSTYLCATKVVMMFLMNTSVSLDFDIIVYTQDSRIVSLYDGFDPRKFNSEWTGELIIKTKQDMPRSDYYYYEWCLLKFMPFNETKYDRLILLDSDIYGPIKDLTHLFQLPEHVTLAAPIAYWLKNFYFTSLLLVVKPNPDVFVNLTKMFVPHTKGLQTDMDILNKYFRPKSIAGNFSTIMDLILLPNEYSILTHSIRMDGSKKNPIYIGPPEKVLDKAFLVHYTEGKKPWLGKEGRGRYYGNVFEKWNELANKLCKTEVDDEQQKLWDKLINAEIKGRRSMVIVKDEDVLIT